MKVILMMAAITISGNFFTKEAAQFNDVKTCQQVANEQKTKHPAYSFWCEERKDTPP